MKPYSSNRYDCVGFVLDKLKMNIEREILPNGWWYDRNCLIENVAEILRKKKISIKVRAFILNQKYILPGDIVFMKIKGKYTHHIGIAKENGHVFHNLPHRNTTIDYLRPNFFRFGVRLWD